MGQDAVVASKAEVCLKVLMISRYAEPQLVGGNNNVFRQASSLTAAPGIRVEVLTWPFNDRWTGSIPQRAATDGPPDVPYLLCERAGLTYHVITLPHIWNDRVLTDAEWTAAVDTGMRLLDKLQPSMIHLQHWAGLWWMLEAAQRLQIPTVYTSHDWGLACLRTILITGWGQLCDGVVRTDKCVKCIYAGRNLIGKVNEGVASLPIGEQMLRYLYDTRMQNRLMTRGVVRIDLKKRVGLALERVQQVVSSAQALIVPSSFGRAFFSQLGVPDERIHVLPWYYDPPALPPAPLAKRQASWSWVTSADCRLRRASICSLTAISTVRSTSPIRLLIAGAIDNQYAAALRRRYPYLIGEHSVEWLGWVSHDDVARVYRPGGYRCRPVHCDG